jgi:hypothetical protein
MYKLHPLNILFMVISFIALNCLIIAAIEKNQKIQKVTRKQGLAEDFF